MGDTTTKSGPASRPTSPPVRSPLASSSPYSIASPPSASPARLRRSISNNAALSASKTDHKSTSLDKNERPPAPDLPYDDTAPAHTTAPDRRAPSGMEYGMSPWVDSNEIIANWQRRNEEDARKLKDLRRSKHPERKQTKDPKSENRTDTDTTEVEETPETTPPLDFKALATELKESLEINKADLVFGLKHLSKARDIVSIARDKGKFNDLKHAFSSLNDGQSLEEYVYKQTKSAGHPELAIFILESERLWRALPAVYRESQSTGWLTRNKAMGDILKSLDSEELKRMEAAWNKIYQTSAPDSKVVPYFRNMLDAHLSSEDKKTVLKRLNDAHVTEVFDIETKAKDLHKALGEYTDPNLVTSIITEARDLSLFDKLALEFRKQSSMDLYSSLRNEARVAALGTDTHVHPIRWLQGDRVADGISAIFYQAKGSTDPEKLRLVIGLYKDVLPQIRDAWDGEFGFKDTYGSSFEEMLAYELPDTYKQYTELLQYEVKLRKLSLAGTPSLTVLKKEDAAKFNFEKNYRGDKGLVSPAGILINDPDSKYWRVIRTINRDGVTTPAVLTVAKAKDTDHEKAILAAYDLLTDKEKKSLQFRKIARFTSAVKFDETEFESAEIRTDGSVLFYPKDQKETLSVIRPIEDENGSFTWSSIKVELDKKNGSVKAIPAERP